MNLNLDEDIFVNKIQIIRNAAKCKKAFNEKFSNRLLIVHLTS